MEINTTPLVVDLDHTLIETDLLFLSSLGVLSKKTLVGFSLLFLAMERQRLSKRSTG